MIFTVELIIEVHKRIIATSGWKDGVKDTALLD
jgi:hypothetical protein